jgi:hypothetical protein
LARLLLAIAMSDDGYRVLACGVLPAARPHDHGSTPEVKNYAYLFDRFPPGSHHRDANAAPEWSQNLGESPEQATRLWSLPALNGKELYCAAMTANGSICAFGGHGNHDSSEASLHRADASPSNTRSNRYSMVPAEATEVTTDLDENGVNLFVYDMDQGHPVSVPLKGWTKAINHLSERVNGVALSPTEGNVLAACSFSGAVALFVRRLQEYKLVRVLRLDLEQVQ